MLQKETNTKHDILLYPNPAKDFVNIVSNEFDKFSEIEIVITNSDGGVSKNIWFITDVIGSFNKQIDLEGLSEGLYFVTIISSARVQNKQLIVR